MRTAAAHWWRVTSLLTGGEGAPPRLALFMSSVSSEQLVVVTANGLYCPPGDFYIDPWKPVQNAVITRAHGDHLRRGSARYIVARPGAPIAKLRLGGDRELEPIEYGARLTLGATNVSLHPAGPILGSSQVRSEYGGLVWIVSGDY